MSFETGLRLTDRGNYLVGSTITSSDMALSALCSVDTGGIVNVNVGVMVAKDMTVTLGVEEAV